MLSAMPWFTKSTFPNNDWSATVTPALPAVGITVQLLMISAGDRFAAKGIRLNIYVLIFGACLSLLFIPLSIPNLIPAQFVIAVITGTLLGGFSTCFIQSCGGALLSTASPDAAAAFSNGLAFAGIVSLVVSEVTSSIFDEQIASFSLFSVCGGLFIVCVFDQMRYLRQRRSLSQEDKTHLSVIRHSGSEMIPEETLQATTQEPTSVWASVARGWVQESIMLLNYILTFAVFPQINLKWPARVNLSADDYSLFMITTFQVFDLSGRLLCGSRVFKFMPGPRSNWTLLVIRLATLPFFFLGWLRPNTVFGSFPLLFITMVLFAVLNGVVTTLCFIHAGTTAEVRDKDWVNRATAMCINVGIMVGSGVCSVAQTLLQS